MADISTEQITEIAQRVKSLLSAESQGVGEIPVVNNLAGIRSLPALQRTGEIDKVVEAPLTLLIGETGATPVLTFKIKALAYGSEPTVNKTGTAGAPTITIGFPLAKNGDELQVRKGVTGIEAKYETEEEAAWRVLWTYRDVMPDVSDFSPEGIALLQKPAQDAANETRTLNTAIAEKEKERDAAEETRKQNEEDRRKKTVGYDAAEALRKKGEEDRETAEGKRGKAEGERNEREDARIVNNELWKKAEAGRVEAEENREEETVKRLVASDAAVERLNRLSDNRDKIVDGYWWHYNEGTGEYEETGERAHGDVLYATFGLNPATGVLTMCTDEKYNGANFELDNGILKVTI
ncbi:hypothetical protein [Parabacteroides sp. PF5-9]|uniref:hypothetical protein n=1 Tax=Parabacteroides sp. PF5-9 TaxID=1742404 RepID=UPI002475B273|nr:hypothetical protein [Parabacteroides sp. PF5-9]MDH6357248.1 hypothetical protein [Parabacteroides sp. PF5-9]